MFSLPHSVGKVHFKNVPKVNVYRYWQLRKQGVAEEEAEAEVMADWRERYNRARIASAAGTLLRRNLDPLDVHALVMYWATTELGVDPETVTETVEWVAARELERIGGEAVGSNV